LALPVSGHVRTFVGLELPEAHRLALARHLDECTRIAPSYRWVQPDSLHLTLRFIGWIEPARLRRVERELGTIRSRPFELAMGERGTFGSRASPRVVWLGLAEGLDACAALAAAAEAACLTAGLDADARRFQAHVTLGRAREEGERLPPLPEPPRLAPWTVQDLVLYESRLRQQPRYVPLQRYPLVQQPAN